MNDSKYSLLDSGDGKILEKIGPYTIARPFAKAIWKKNTPSLWKNCHASFEGNMDGGKGKWLFLNNCTLEPFYIYYQDIRFEIRLTPYGHVGLFFEHLTLWHQLSELKHSKTPSHILNLFAYTGATSLFLSQYHTVTHVDSSKPVLNWARKNQAINTTGKNPVKWIEEDAFKFVQRELKRKHQYDGIILDPPTFGRGAKNEIWKIDTDLPVLLEHCIQLLKPEDSHLLITSHTPGMTPLFLEHLIRSLSIPKKIKHLDSQELYLIESSTGLKLSFGAYCLVQF